MEIYYQPTGLLNTSAVEGRVLLNNLHSLKALGWISSGGSSFEGVLLGAAPSSMRREGDKRDATEVLRAVDGYLLLIGRGRFATLTPSGFAVGAFAELVGRV